MALGLALLILASSAFYIVDETQQVIVTQFGEPSVTPSRHLASRSRFL